MDQLILAIFAIAFGVYGDWRMLTIFIAASMILEELSKIRMAIGGEDK